MSSNNQALTLFKDTERKLEAISPSFCAAKWLQVTLHLSTGTNHSCHHPKVHFIPVDELEKNPSALHNTEYKKELRKQMKEGVRPGECDYCWRVEDSTKNQPNVYSDRITKSSEVWAAPHLQKIAAMPWDADVVPTYVEVDFDTTCNFKCAYCSPLYSTTWMQEIKQHGPYILDGVGFNDISDLSKGKGLPILQSEENPYIEAFWKWWPDAVKSMHTFRITGGEPLLSKNTFKVLDFLIENPQPHLEFSLNSNLGSPPEVIEKFLEKLEIIEQKKAVKQIHVFTSCEAHGKKAEYIRFGLDYDYWLKNVHKILQRIETSRVTIMSTYNVLSITSFLPFLKDMLEVKNTYATPTRLLPLSVDVPYLRHPEWLAPWIATENFTQHIVDCVTFMYANKEVTDWFPLQNRGLYDHEIHRMRRIHSLAVEQMGNTRKNLQARINFAKFIDEYDKRRGTDFFEVFPEYKDFYNYCKETVLPEEENVKLVMNLQQ